MYNKEKMKPYRKIFAMMRRILRKNGLFTFVLALKKNKFISL